MDRGRETTNAALDILPSSSVPGCPLFPRLSAFDGGTSTAHPLVTTWTVYRVDGVDVAQEKERN